MKTQKINQKNATNAAIKAFGFATGLATGGAFGNLAESVAPSQPEIGKIGLAGAGLLGGTAISDKDELGAFCQSLSLGVAGKQIYELISDAIKGSITVKPVEERSTVDEMLYGAIGLGCPGNAPANYLAAPSMNFAPTLDVDWEEDAEPKRLSSLI